MRRTVKAWGIQTETGRLKGTCRWRIRGVVSTTTHNPEAGDTFVRGVFTYDDGRPAPKRRKAKGGRRG